VGFWRDRDQLRKVHKVARRFVPKLDSATREAMVARWRRAVERA
jgi:glycerol kinase